MIRSQNEFEELVIYVLNKQYGIVMRELMLKYNISQGTVSNIIRRVENNIAFRGYTKLDLENAKREAFNRLSLYKRERGLFCPICYARVEVNWCVCPHCRRELPSYFL